MRSDSPPKADARWPRNSRGHDRSNNDNTLIKHLSPRVLRMRTGSRFTVLSVLVLVSSACFTRNPHADGLSSSTIFFRAHSRSAGDRLDDGDFSSVDRMSLDDALRHLRPDWFRLPVAASLTAEPALVSVYINLVYAGSVNSLRLVPVSAVRGVRYLRPSAARDRFGPSCPCAGGVILVSTVTTPNSMDGVVAW